MFILILSLAAADVISPEEDVCRDAEVGETCRTSGVRGTCQLTTCYRNDYSEGTPPRTIEVECMRCLRPGADPDDPDAARSGGCDTAAGWPVGPVSLVLGLGIAGALIGRRRYT